MILLSLSMIRKSYEDVKLYWLTYISTSSAQEELQTTNGPGEHYVHEHISNELPLTQVRLS